jgi:hypothetical protein
MEMVARKGSKVMRRHRVVYGRVMVMRAPRVV